MKLTLPARVPNEGARRLAYFLHTGAPTTLAAFARGIEETEMMIDRLVAGEIVPCAQIANAIFRATGGKVWRTDWVRPAQGGWFERPIDRATTRAAA